MASVTVHVAPEGTCWQCKGEGTVCNGMAMCGGCGSLRNPKVWNVVFRIDMPEVLWWSSRFVYRLLRLAYAPEVPIDKIAAVVVTRYQEARWFDKWPPSPAEMVRRMSSGPT